MQPVNDDMTLGEVKTYVKALFEKNGWDTLGPDSQALYLTAEIGELCQRLIELKYVEHELNLLDYVDEGKRKMLEAKHEQIRHKAGEELSDVLWNTVAVGWLLGLDIPAAARAKMSADLEREWD